MDVSIIVTATLVGIAVLCYFIGIWRTQAALDFNDFIPLLAESVAVVASGKTLYTAFVLGMMLDVHKKLAMQDSTFAQSDTNLAAQIGESDVILLFIAGMLFFVASLYMLVKLLRDVHRLEVGDQDEA